MLWLLVEDLLPRWATFFDPPALEVDGQRVQVILLWSGETKRIEYTISLQSPRLFSDRPDDPGNGRHDGTLPELSSRQRIRSTSRCCPDVFPLTSYEIGSRRPIGEIRMRENVMDDPTRLRGIRQWQPGDPMRSVHWAATARTGSLHSKVYEPSSIIGATLVLDLHESTTPKEHEPTSSDLAVTAAASIAASLARSKRTGGPGHQRSRCCRPNSPAGLGRRSSRSWRSRVEAAVDERARTSDCAQCCLPPSRGPVHLAEINRTLARLGANRRTDLDRVVGRM